LPVPGIQGVPEAAGYVLFRKTSAVDQSAQNFTANDFVPCQRATSLLAQRMDHLADETTGLRAVREMIREALHDRLPDLNKRKGTIAQLQHSSNHLARGRHCRDEGWALPADFIERRQLSLECGMAELLDAGFPCRDRDAPVPYHPCSVRGHLKMRFHSV